MNPTTPLPTPTARLQARVSYFSGLTVLSENYAILEWGADNRIRLFIANADTNQATAVVFDAALTDIQKVGGSGAMLVFIVAGNRYRLEFSTGTRIATATGTIIGMIVGYKMAQASGINNWLRDLRANNIKVTYITWRAILAIIIGGSFVGIVVVMLSIVLTT